jgi:hypothetical protein
MVDAQLDHGFSIVDANRDNTARRHNFLIYGNSPRPRVHLGDRGGACDGFACTFFNTLAWRDDTSPLPVGINPRVTFERMFGETDSKERRFARLKEKQSLLDSVTEETAKLRGSLGAPDRAILDEYLGNIRDVKSSLIAWKAVSEPSRAIRKRRWACRMRSTIT